jgi:hypothetical protein
MSLHESLVRLCHMLDHAREAVAMASGRSRDDLDNDRKLNLALVRLLEEQRSVDVVKDPRHLCFLYTQQRPELGGHFREHVRGNLGYELCASSRRNRAIAGLAFPSAVYRFSEGTPTSGPRFRKETTI